MQSTNPSTGFDDLRMAHWNFPPRSVDDMKELGGTSHAQRERSARTTPLSPKSVGLGLSSSRQIESQVGITHSRNLTDVQRRLSVVDLDSPDNTPAFVARNQQAEIPRFSHCDKDPVDLSSDDGIELEDHDSAGFNPDDYLSDHELQNFITSQTEEEIRRTNSRCSRSGKSAYHLNKTPRNGPLLPPFVSLDSHTHNGTLLRPKANVELNDGDFLRIIDVVRDTSTDEVVLRGWSFRRTNEMNGLLGKKLNEVCWILHVDDDDPREAKLQAVDSIAVSEVKRRRMIRLTNRDFPALSFRESLEKEPESVIKNERQLICRFKYICRYQNSMHREKNAWVEKALHRLREEECDSQCGQGNNALRSAWRGNTILGGSGFGATHQEVVHLKREHRERRVALNDLQISKATRPYWCQHESAATTGLGLTVGSPSVFDPHVLPFALSRDGFQMHNALATQRNETGNSRAATQSVKNVDLTASDEPDVLEKQTHGANTTLNRMSMKRRNTSPDLFTETNATFITKVKGGVYESEYTGRVSTTFSSSHSDDSDIEIVDGSKHKSPSTPRKCPRTEGLMSPRASASTPSTARSKKLGLPSSTSPIEIEGEMSDTHKSAPRIQQFGERSTLSTNEGSSSNVNGLASTKRFEKLAKQRYTYGDGFCGAGGMTRGAFMAGLQIAWGFDMDPSALKSWGLNFPWANRYEMMADHFTILKDEDFRVDILHLSPPCQFFSDAHTVEGKDDDKNIASLFAVSELLKFTRPRVVCLEQTSGLARRHHLFMNSLVMMFTAFGFSIRWKVLNFADYGLPQKRSRLMIIASWSVLNILENF